MDSVIQFFPRRRQVQYRVSLVRSSSATAFVSRCSRARLAMLVHRGSKLLVVTMSAVQSVALDSVIRFSFRCRQYMYNFPHLYLPITKFFSRCWCKKNFLQRFVSAFAFTFQGCLGDWLGALLAPTATKKFLQLSSGFVAVLAASSLIVRADFRCRRFLWLGPSRVQSDRGSP